MSFQNSQLPKEVMIILEKLNQVGEGFLVGGSLRDILLGNIPKDFDFSTNLEYKTLKKIFVDYHCIETGKAFGVLRIQKEGREFEIAKFRKDIGSDGRRPKRVEYVESVEEDLARRDFTVNAFAYNIKRGFIDIFEGRIDLEEKILRFIGKPEERIEEDGLRIMRAFRFVSQLGFQLEEKTKLAITKNYHVLEKVSKERIREEFYKLLLGDFVILSLETMRECQVLEWLFPEIKAIYDYSQNTPYHSYDLWKHTLEVLAHTKKDVATRLAALFHDIGKPTCKTVDIKTGYYHFYGYEKKSAKMLGRILEKHLGRNKKIMEESKLLIENHMLFCQNSNEKKLRKTLYTLGPETTERLVDLAIADAYGKGKGNHNEKEFLREKLRNLIQQEEKKPMKLAINGYDLLAMGFVGKEIQEIKDSLLEKVLEEKLENTRDILLQEVEKEKV